MWGGTSGEGNNGDEVCSRWKGSAGPAEGEGTAGEEATGGHYRSRQAGPTGKHAGPGKRTPAAALWCQGHTLRNSLFWCLMWCVNLQYALIMYMFSGVFVFDYASVGEWGDETFPWTGESQGGNQFSRHQSKVGSEQTEEWNGCSQGKPENIVK